ncbi:AlpA family transcriptional regulator [Microbulbifer taiwanensis]|uniref:AlpA family transcriptional regulator n=1 Tax=Microbulbifer taiwanensis TaxID=986746 RepID=A0ABW1YJI1_9GAMM|nr:AlpA family transcriptional regulator [Microbulbifer taiwanensis]
MTTETISPRILRLPEVQSKTGLPRSAVYELMSKGDFPKNVKLGPRAVGWDSREIDAWIRGKLSQRRA